MLGTPVADVPTDGHSHGSGNPIRKPYEVWHVTKIPPKFTPWIPIQCIGMTAGHAASCGQPMTEYKFEENTRRVSEDETPRYFTQARYAQVLRPESKGSDLASRR